MRLFLIFLLALGSLQAQIRRPERSAPLAGRATLVGQILDSQTGAGIAGVRIDLRGPAGSRRTFSGLDGTFSFREALPGSGTIALSADAFQTPEAQRIELRQDETTALQFKLTRRAGPQRADRILRPPGRRTTPLPEEPIRRPVFPFKEARFAERRIEGSPVVPPVSNDAVRRPYDPLGHAGAGAQTEGSTPDFVILRDRWRIGLPRWERYARAVDLDSPYATGRRLDPYNQNVLKGDYPLFGDRWFLVLDALSDTLTEYRRLPVVGPPSAQNPGGALFFSPGDQLLAVEQVSASFDFFRGYASFRPLDFRVRVTPAANLNYLRARENTVVNIDVRQGSSRVDGHASLEEAFVEVKLADTSPFYDFVSLRAGTQFFNSDFRGFVFMDNQPGVRLFGNFKSNRHQYNLAYFNLVEKDTNSQLNRFHSRHQHVAVANYYIQDFLAKGYTAQWSVHYNNDRPSRHFNTNDFITRPAPIGDVVPKSVNAIYLGWTGDGHFGPLNITHAFYQVLGRERPNQIAGNVFGPVKTKINAQMAALELSVDHDWRRYRGAFFYASGDDDPNDEDARGFDSILDQPFFAGAGVSFFNRQEIRLSGTAVGLVHRFSLLPNLRSSKEEGQSNFVNPGLWLVNGGVDAELTPKLRGSANLNVLSFAHTEVLQALLFQSDISRFIGIDLGLGLEYRPWLNNNVILSAGTAALLPGAGFRDIYSSKSLLSSFFELRLEY